MDIDIDKLSTLLFSSTKNVEFIHQLNSALKYLIQRDSSFVASNRSEPQVWECKWLNQPKTRGYEKGQTVWMNVNTYQQIVSSRRQTIESYVVNNPKLNSLYAKISPASTTERTRFLINAANGTASPDVSAVFCLGDIADKVQIRISKIDDNKTYPTDLCYWDDFFVRKTYQENVDMLLAAALSSMNNAVSEHLSDYHKVGITWFDLETNGFFKKNPFNVADVQTQDFFDHNYCSKMTGFDFIKQWKMTSDGSQWCKIWNSGYVEQGGFIDNLPGNALLPVQFMTTYNYPLGASFYQRDYQTYAGAYAIDNPLQASNRYVATVTPVMLSGAQPYPDHPIDVENELVYAAVDMTDMSNNGFSIVNTDMGCERYSKYSWYVCGYKVINSDSQMFDGGINGSSIAPLSAFSISNGVLNSFSGGYATVIVPAGVTSIAYRAFYYNQTMKSVSLPSTLTSIGSNAFDGCTNLRGVVIPDGVKSIPEEAFLSCYQLSYVKMGTGVTYIGGGAFSRCEKLATFTRFNDADPSHTFDKVGNWAFYRAKLKKINLSLRSAGIDNFWGDYCFQECKNLEEVNILSSCYMSTRMFKDCISLKTVNFKNNHTSYVYPGVFDGCVSLTSITLPSKIWYISEEMFKGCTNLRSVKFNTYDAADSMINLVQKYAFNGCSILQNIELPASLTALDQLDDGCLSGCPSLTSISFHGIPLSNIINSEGEIVDYLRENAMYRLNHDCTIIASGGEAVKFNYVAGEADPYVEQVDYNATKVDRTTTNVFYVANDSRNGGKYWYYNAQQLCPYARTWRTPVLVIYSLLGCKPCQVYMKKIFNNPAFQTWAAKQKFFLCGMEVQRQPSFDTQLNYCVNTLVPTALNFAKEDQGQTLNDVVPNALGNKYRRWRVDSNLLNSNLTTPVIVFYYYQNNQQKAYVHTFHNIDKEINAWGVNGVIQCLKSLCLYYFDNNNISSPTFVVDAGKAFNADDYTIASAQPPASDSPYVVIPVNESGQAFSTVNDLNAYIATKVGSDYTRNGVPYLMNCVFDDVPFLADTFAGINTEVTIAGVNALVARGTNSQYRFKVGDSYYKFSLSTTDTMQVPSRCIEGISTLTAGAPVWTLSTAPA